MLRSMPSDINTQSTALIAAIQLNSRDSITQNLASALVQLKLAKKEGAYCAVLPENFAWMGEEKTAHLTAEPNGSGRIQTFLSESAKSLGLWIIGGSHRLRPKNNNDSRATNSTLVFDPKGKQRARYDKIHLFDADISDGNAYRESSTIEPGDTLCVVDTGIAKIGLSICYDLRFPEMYRALADQGADIIVVPAAFTAVTGQAHWEILLRARAIENQVYIIAPSQTGTHFEGRTTWGHSMCINPWGEIVSEVRSQIANCYCHFNAEELARIRSEMPVQSHRRTGFGKIE